MKFDFGAAAHTCMVISMGCWTLFLAALVAIFMGICVRYWRMMLPFLGMVTVVVFAGWCVGHFVLRL